MAAPLMPYPPTDNREECHDDRRKSNHCRRWHWWAQLALTLDQIGVPFVVFESVQKLRPLGVGINLQPNAVRELYDMGIDAEELDEIGLPAKEWALVGLNGNDIYAEPRGLLAGIIGRSTLYTVASSKCHRTMRCANAPALTWSGSTSS